MNDQMSGAQGSAARSVAKALLALAVVLALPMPLHAQLAPAPLSVEQAPVTGMNVTQVDVENGYFAYSPADRRWIEFNNDGVAKFNFSVPMRDEQSVYLYDGSRDVKLRLDLSLNKVFYAAGNDSMVPIYEITHSFQAEPATPQQVSLPVRPLPVTPLPTQLPSVQPSSESTLTVQNYTRQSIDIYVDGPEGPVFVIELGALEQLVQPAQSEQIWRWAQNDEWLGGRQLEAGPVTVRVPQ